MKILALLLLSLFSSALWANTSSLDERIFKNELFLAKKNVAESMFSVALRYRFAQGVAKNDSEADKWMLSAVAAGSDIARYYTAIERGRMGRSTARDQSLYRTILAKADDIVKRDGSVKYAEGLMYLYGISVDKDVDKAMVSFNTAKFMNADYSDDNAVAEIKREYAREAELVQRKNAAEKAIRSEQLAALALVQKNRNDKARADRIAHHQRLSAKQKASVEHAEEKRKYDEYIAFQKELARETQQFEAQERLRMQNEEQDKQEELKVARLKAQKTKIKRIMIVDPCTTSAAVFMSTC